MTDPGKEFAKQAEEILGPAMERSRRRLAEARRDLGSSVVPAMVSGYLWNQLWKYVDSLPAGTPLEEDLPEGEFIVIGPNANGQCLVFQEFPGGATVTPHSYARIMANAPHVTRAICQMQL